MSTTRDAPFITVRGIVVAGHGVASGTGTDTPYPRSAIELQKPHFRERGLDLAPYYNGTINISIAPFTFRLHRPAYTFRHVEWTTLHPPEHFSFSACKIVAHTITYPGWIYYPHPETKRAHMQDPSVLEILAPYIPNIRYGDRVEVAVNSDEVTLDHPIH